MLTIIAAGVVFCFASSASAKRSAPKEVASVILDGMEYRVPMGIDRQGYIDAYDAKTGRLVWARQIFVVIKDPNLEGDVQDVFITAIKADGRELLITNERGYEYRLDLTSLDVKVIKGTTAIRR